MWRTRARLTVALILAWADDDRAGTGDWPRIMSGPLDTRPGETWRRLDTALRYGYRGLPGGDSLPRLLTRERGYRNIRCLPLLTEAQVLAWADAHRSSTGRWPTEYSGPIREAPGAVWANVNQALLEGTRGLPGGSSLARLLKYGRPLGSAVKELVTIVPPRTFARWLSG